MKQIHGGALVGPFHHIQGSSWKGWSRCFLPRQFAEHATFEGIPQIRIQPDIRQVLWE